MLVLVLTWSEVERHGFLFFSSVYFLSCYLQQMKKHVCVPMYRSAMKRLRMFGLK